MTCGAAEDGLITYMRTDSPTLDDDAALEIREAVEAIYGLDFLSDEANLYKYVTPEAIRPGQPYVPPDTLS